MEFGLLSLERSENLYFFQPFLKKKKKKKTLLGTLEIRPQLSDC